MRDRAALRRIGSLDPGLAGSTELRLCDLIQHDKYELCAGATQVAAGGADHRRRSPGTAVTLALHWKALWNLTTWQQQRRTSYCVRY